MSTIKVETIIRGDITKVWRCWNDPEHITMWAFAADDWECPHAENDPRTGGKFLIRMSAKDGSSGFDFTGTYTDVVPEEKIAYIMSDGRKVSVDFQKLEDGTVRIIEEFDPEHENPEEVQRQGWQSILDNFKKHVETEDR